MLEYHEQKMAERVANKTKRDATLQEQSTKERKDKVRWNDNKGRRGYNNLTSRGN